MRKEYSTRTDAERVIAQRGLAGRKRARRVGGKWFLATNESGTVNRSLATEMLKVELRKQASREQWSESRLKRKLMNANSDASRIWREVNAEIRDRSKTKRRRP